MGRDGPEQQLARYMKERGYVRRQNVRRLRQEGPQGYKKGFEVRLIASSEAEMRTLRRLLRQFGVKPGRPFRKGLQYRQPVYGREATERLLALIEPRERH